MNCAPVRQQLLASERPDRPGPVLSRHLRACDSCRAWLRRLVKLERQLPSIPVEVPPVPAALFEALEPAGPLVRPFLPSRPDRREGGRRKVALASALAAALLLFAIGWWAWPHLQSDPAAPSLAGYAARRDAHLAKALTAPQRVQALGALAGELLKDARDAAPADVERLALHLDQLLAIDLPRQARALSLGERGAVLRPVLERLGGMESEASRLAAARTGKTAAAYARMALSAREADRRLRAMLST